jgi:uncharacterized protein YwqG
MAKKLDTLLKPLLKPCTRLILNPDRSAKAQSLQTKFGGLPYLESHDEWPMCSACGNALVFIAQFNLSDCAHETPDNALYLFYYCMECLPWGGKDSERGQWAVRRYVDATLEKLKPLSKAASNPEQAIPPCTVRHGAVMTLPDWEELDNADIRAACAALDAQEPWEAYAEAATRLGSLHDSATLIDAYPFWIQGRAEKNCPQCSAPMQVLIQIDSDEKIRLMWGDMGLIYLFQCRQHPHIFTFELQCY